MSFDRRCSVCGVVLDKNHEGDRCYLCMVDAELSPETDWFPWEGDLQDVEEDEITIDQSRG